MPSSLAPLHGRRTTHQPFVHLVARSCCLPNLGAPRRNEVATHGRLRTSHTFVHNLKTSPFPPFRHARPELTRLPICTTLSCRPTHLRARRALPGSPVQHLGLFTNFAPADNSTKPHPFILTQRAGAHLSYLRHLCQAFTQPERRSPKLPKISCTPSHNWAPGAFTASSINNRTRAMCLSQEWAHLQICAFFSICTSHLVSLHHPRACS